MMKTSWALGGRDKESPWRQKEQSQQPNSNHHIIHSVVNLPG